MAMDADSREPGLFTTCPDGHFLMVTRGAEFYKIIHSIRGWRVNESLDFVKSTSARPNLVSPLKALLGYDFVGFPPFQKAHRHVFGSGMNAEWYLPFESRYTLSFRNVNIGGASDKKHFIPVDFEATTTIRMERPRIALMRNKDWLAVVAGEMLDAISHFGSRVGYEQLVTKATGDPTEFLSTGSGIQQRLLTTAGVRVTDGRIVSVAPHEEYTRAAVRVATTGLVGDAIRSQAKAEGDAEVLRAQGTAAASDLRSSADSRRLERTVIKVAGGPGELAVEAFKWDRVASDGSKLTTVVEVKNLGPIVTEDR